MFGRNKKLFGTNITPACEYCKYSQFSQDHQFMLCKLKGIVTSYYHCRKFCYVPTRRIPKKMRKLPEFDPSDFEL